MRQITLKQAEMIKDVSAQLKKDVDNNLSEFSYEDADKLIKTLLAERNRGRKQPMNEFAEIVLELKKLNELLNEGIGIKIIE